ncbi:MAG: LLM class F420-dependent oxidoreductase [Acidobacteria bacterium]|nr:MAG: LLM class F420-dependent oxidoreductase [Acidobacteriota bacterium]
MEFGLHIVRFDFAGGPSAIGPSLRSLAEAAEAAGFGEITLMDHYFQLQMIGARSEPMIEGYTGLGYLAAVTNQIKLGLLVTGVTYRHPGLLVKIATTLDVLSGGRSVFGIGAAWYEEEHLGLGVPFPPLSERFERLEETLQICHQMWSDNDGAFEGKHYSLAETICSPSPVTSPHPPIRIGGNGEKKTLRLVAQYADSCNIMAPDTQTVERKIEVLRNHCESLGRDPSEIEITVMVFQDPLADPDRFLDQVRAFGELGVTMTSVAPQRDQVAYATEFGERIIGAL